jgi:branched-chain amino acid transport system substrate-binding protein
MHADHATARRRPRRRVIAALALLALAGAACGGDDADSTDAAGGPASTEAEQAAGGEGGEPAAEGTGDPITVGVISSYTGPFGIYGDPMELALNLRLAAADNLAGNRPIEVVYEDDATDPAVAVQKATKLIEEDGATVVVCCVNAGSTFAVAPLLADAGIPQIVPIANPLGVEDNPNAFVAGPSVNYDAERLGAYAAEDMGHQTAVVVAMDMAYGQAVADAFTQGFTDAGGEVVDTILTPFGTEDFGSFLGSIPEADVVFGGFAGADGIAFVNQYQQFGLRDRSPLLGHGPLITELLLQAEGPAAVDTTAGFYYTSQLDNAENEAFIAALREANPDIPPSHFTAGAWATGTVLLTALAAADDPGSGDSVRDAIAAAEIDAPWGPMTFDAETHYVFGPTFVYTVVDDSGGLRHEVVATIE